MSENTTGGCACGAIRFAIPGRPVAMNDCQCRDCQRRSGTGHSSYLVFTGRPSMTVTGEAKEWDITGDGGTLKRHAFCPTCGSPVYLTLAQMPDLFLAHAASLDEPARYQPQFVQFTVSGQAWDAVDASLQTFERMPPPPSAG
ncbi:MAG: GFA family protein [Pseudomonadota bacterium]